MNEIEQYDEAFGPSTQVRAIVTVVLVALIALFVFGLAPHFASPEVHAGTIATIDEKIDNVLTLTAGSAGASALISAIPGDAGSPIAEKLMDLSTGFLIVLAALFLEKYLIAIFSGVASALISAIPGDAGSPIAEKLMDLSTGFLIVLAALFLEKYLIAIFSGVALGLVMPLAFLAAIVFTWAYGRARWSDVPVRLGFKFALIGAVLLLAIPTSTWVTNQVDAMYDTSLTQSVETAEALAEGAAEAESEGGKKDEGGILGFFQGAIDTVTGGISSAVEGAQESLNQFIESLAVMLVTSCLIPLLVLLFYFWMAKILLGGFRAPSRAPRSRSTSSSSRWR